jgi:hypothetical protein
MSRNSDWEDHIKPDWLLIWQHDDNEKQLPLLQPVLIPIYSNKNHQRSQLAYHRFIVGDDSESPRQ